MTKKHPKTSKSKEKKKKIFKWFLVVLVISSILLGVKFYLLQKEMASKREVMEAQRQIMLEHWQEQGLSEEEIKEKLAEERQNLPRDGESSVFRSVMRTVRHTTGTGPGTGPR